MFIILIKQRLVGGKNGYPEYFAKVINAPSWIGISILIDEIPVDLNKVYKVEMLERILDMKNGLYERAISFKTKDNFESGNKLKEVYIHEKKIYRRNFI